VNHSPLFVARTADRLEHPEFESRSIGHSAEVPPRTPHQLNVDFTNDRDRPNPRAGVVTQYVTDSTARGRHQHLDLDAETPVAI
jgi:hypothetical protein